MVVEAAIRRRLLKLPAQSLLRLGHRRDRRELLQQRVPPEGTLNRQRGVPRLHAAVFPLQHLDLFVQQILRQLVPVQNEIAQFLPSDPIFSDRDPRFFTESEPLRFRICYSFAVAQRNV